MNTSLTQHTEEVRETLAAWDRKPALQSVYREFYRQIAGCVTREVPGRIVELGSGIGNLKQEIPDCLCTDIMEAPWIDQVEDAYRLSFADGEVSNLILFDVFHHLEYPGTALREMARAVAPGGRVVLFEPAVSLLGLLVYGPCHHEPIGLFRSIAWDAPEGFDPSDAPYYSGQGNAGRIFRRSGFAHRGTSWELLEARRLAALAYVATGGYRAPQLLPGGGIALLGRLEKALGWMPWIFATRLLVVLERRRD